MGDRSSTSRRSRSSRGSAGGAKGSAEGTDNNDKLLADAKQAFDKRASKSGGKTKSVKMVAVGDLGVGKTSLLMTYAKQEFPTEYIPTVFDNYLSVLRHGDYTVNLSLWDTAGWGYTEYRTMSFPGTDVFLVCFAIDEPGSLQSLEEHWIPELRKFGPKNAPFMVCGCKMDQRGNAKKEAELAKQSLTMVTYEQGEAMAKKLGAMAYRECSAMELKQLDDVFYIAAAAGLGMIKWGDKQATSCCLQ